MNADTLFVSELFNAPERYIVPLYQRRYVWNRERQWAPLWQDIRSRAEEYLAGASPVHPHFMGAVVVAPRPRSGPRDLTSYDVIDGQQRLTTFQVILAAFRDVTEELGNEISEDIASLVQNTSRHASPEAQYKVWPTRFDQESFMRVVTERNPTGLASEIELARKSVQHVPNLISAYVFFAGEIRDWLTVSQSTERIDALWATFTTYLQVVRIDLEAQDDPQVIFETLNARGAPLEAADLIRNHIFNEAARSREDVERLFQRYWAAFDQDGSFWRSEVSRGRIRRNQLTWFLTYFLTIQRQREISDANVFEEFKQWWKGRSDTVEDRLILLERHARAYEQYMLAAPDTRLGVFRSRMDSMELSTLTPLLLYLLTERLPDAAQLDALLTDLESFTVRRYITRLGNRSYGLHFLRVLQEMMQSDDLPATLKQALSTSVAESARWPTDAEVSEALLNEPTYKTLRARGALMLLEAIEMHMTTGKQEQLLFRAIPTVEHVLPQRWRTHWPEPQAPEGVLDAGAWRDRRLHNLGNLTLITGSLNSDKRMSNKGFESKRQALAEQSLLRMNRYFDHQATWDETTIAQRAAELARQVLEIWPAPASLSAGEARAAQPVMQGSLDEVIRDLELRPIPGYVMVDKDGELHFHLRYSTKKLKYILAQREVDGSEALVLEFRESFTPDHREKPWAQAVFRQVAQQVELTFNEQHVSTGLSEVTIRFDPDFPVQRLRLALERLISVAFPIREQEWARWEGRSGGHEVLTSLESTLRAALPAGFALKAEDLGSDRTYRRVPYALWRDDVHFEVGWDDRREEYLLAFHVEAWRGTPERAALKAVFEELLGELKENLPYLAWTGYTPEVGSLQLEGRVAGTVATPEVAAELRKFIDVLFPTLAQVLASVTSQSADNAAVSDDGAEDEA